MSESINPKIREILERRRRAQAALTNEDSTSSAVNTQNEASGDTSGCVSGEDSTFSNKPPGEPASKGMGRAALIAKLKDKKAAIQKLKEQTTGNSTSQEETGFASGSAGTGSAGNELGVDMERLRMAPTYPAKKKGEKGRVFPASANIIRITIKKDMGVFEYHVKFDPPVDNIRDKKSIIRSLEKDLGTTRSFDGATLCLPILLFQPVLKLQATTLTGDAVTVTIRVVKRRDLVNCEQLFNVLFRKIMENLKYVEIKRNNYDPAARMMVPAHKLEIWPGYVVKCQDMDGGLMLTCDTSYKVLRNESAYSVIQDVQKKGGNFKDNLEKALIGQIVMTEYNKAATYRIDDIDMDQTPLSTFKSYTGEDVTFKDYYKRTYNIDIKDLKQPLLIFRQKKKMALEIQTEKTIVLIPELSRMTGLTDSMRADFRVMKDVALFTKVSPDKRQQALKKFLENVHSNPESMKLLAEWGLELDKEPIRLSARQMEPEKLVMGKGVKFTVNAKADWTREATSTPSLLTVPFNCWHVVCTERDKNVTLGFIKLVKTNAPRMGITVKEPSLSILPNDRSETYLNDLKSKITNSLQIVVIIVPLQREDRYAALKKYCNTDSPIPSQVIVSRTISNEKKVNSVVQKVILQMNCKLGGELWGCNIPLKNLMCVGIDVYHDPTRRSKSVLGAVGSTNNTMSAWSCYTKIQDPGQELVDVLMAALGSLISQYKKANNCHPDQIILYRDGVGDGQIDTVSLHEATQCEEMFRSIGFSPEFAFVIVQKRINRRFFDLTGDKYANPPPGSVLDHTVMKKAYYDFLLISQFVSQGTVTPTHYVVIRDTTKFTCDILQKISYKLTHQYFNWPGTVRVPAPCQYAHKLAYQVGEVTKVEPSPLLCNRPFYL